MFQILFAAATEECYSEILFFRFLLVQIGLVGKANFGGIGTRNSKNAKLSNIWAKAEISTTFQMSKVASNFAQKLFVLLAILCFLRTGWLQIAQIINIVPALITVYQRFVVQQPVSV